MGDGKAALRVFARAALLDMEDLRGRGPEPLFVLITPDEKLELDHTLHSELLVWLYTDVTLLAESCGMGQPYVRTTAAEVADFADSLGKPVLAAVDLWHPARARYPELDFEEFEPLEPMEYQSDGLWWIPTLPGRSVAELYGSRPGERLLLAFGSLDELIDACGPYQAACAIPGYLLETVALESEADGIAWNPVLAEGARHAGPVRDWAAERSMRDLRG